MGSEQFSLILKRLRQSAHLTQDQLADKVGISRSAIGMYESGARTPDPDTLALFADFFNVDLDYLIGRTNKTTVTPETAGRYYLNPETAKVAQEIYEDEDLHALFDTARGASPDELKRAANFLKMLKETNPDG